MSKKSKIFECNIVYLPGHISRGDTTLPTEISNELPFVTAKMLYLNNSLNDDFNNIQSECVIIALCGSFDVILDDGANKKTVHLNKASFGLHLKADIEKQLANISSDAICLVIIPENLPLVSIAAINYNNSKTVIETLESIKSQTYPNIELIIVDDCSTENDVEVINDWLKNYHGPYRFIKHEVNKGISATYNSGLYASSGKYFSTIDTDDAMLPERITTQVKILEASDEKVGAVYSDAYVMDENSTIIDGLFIQKYRQFSKIPSGSIYDILLQGNYIPVMSVLIKKAIFKVVGGYDEGLYDNDFDMWLRIAKKYDIIYSDFISSKYRIRPGSLTFVITLNQWNYTDTKIFLKHVGGPIPMKWIKRIGRDVYYHNDKETLPYLKEMANKTLDRYLLTVCLLGQFRIPIEIGQLILDKIDEGLVAGEPQKANDIDATDQKIFINEIMPFLPVGELHNLVRRFYINKDGNHLLFAKELANKTRDTYLLTAYLLWFFQVPTDVGETILAKINERIIAGIFMNVNVSGSDIQLFINEVLPAIPVDLLHTLAKHICIDGNKRGEMLLKELADNRQDRYLLAAYLLSKFKVSNDIGHSILNILREICDRNSYYILRVNDRDSSLFMNNIYPALPLDLQRKIACNAYCDRNNELISVVKQMAKKTRDKYFKAAFLLSKFKIRYVVGAIILDRILGYIREGKNNFYIDLCIYKDIFEARFKYSATP